MADKKETKPLDQVTLENTNYASITSADLISYLDKIEGYKEENMEYYNYLKNILVLKLQEDMDADVANLVTLVSPQGYALRNLPYHQRLISLGLIPQAAYYGRKLAFGTIAMPSGVWASTEVVAAVAGKQLYVEDAYFQLTFDNTVTPGADDGILITLEDEDGNDCIYGAIGGVPPCNLHLTQANLTGADNKALHALATTPGGSGAYPTGDVTYQIYYREV